MPYLSFMSIHLFVHTYLLSIHTCHDCLWFVHTYRLPLHSLWLGYWLLRPSPPTDKERAKVNGRVARRCHHVKRLSHG